MMVNIDPAKDLAELIAAGQPKLNQGMHYGQGTILSWNAVTFENTIDFRGITLYNVPLSDKIAGLSLKIGDVVGLMGWAPGGGFGSWWIVGELGVPPLSEPVAVEGGASFIIRDDGTLLVLSEDENRWIALRNGGIEFGRISPEGTSVPLSAIHAANQDLIVDASFNTFVHGNNQASLESDSGSVFLIAPNGTISLEDGAGGPIAGSIFAQAGDDVLLAAGDDVVVQAGDSVFLDAGGQMILGSGPDQVFIDHTTTGSAANCFISTGGLIQRSTSSRRYKVDIGDYHAPRTILDLKPVKFRDRNEAEADPDIDHWIVGLIAEDVADLGLHELVSYDTEGRADAVDYRALSVALLGEVKQLRADVDALLTASGITASKRPEPTAVPKYVPDAASVITAEKARSTRKETGQGRTGRVPPVAQDR